MPTFEARMARTLCNQSKVYWVTPSTDAKLNGLVESPLTSVVVVVKPPGSDLEFEIKRTGLRGERPLEAVYKKNGHEVPQTHRLHGGSMAYYLRWEAEAEARLSGIYRLIHHEEAPISQVLGISTICGVPNGDGEQHIVRYFCDLNGDPGANERRRGMQHVVNAVRNETGVSVDAPPGDLGLATQFLCHFVPAQAIVAGTSSFRIDKLASYLSPDGAGIYFNALRIQQTPDDERRFADQLLDEVLGVYRQPDTAYRNYGSYVDSALTEPANRAAADRNYLALMGQAGKFWGTLAGIKCHSYGESFVARNVGLRSVFREGRWQVKLIFMDHDGLFLNGIKSTDFRPLRSIPATDFDGKHILGAPDIHGSAMMLASIYRVNPETANEGRTRFWTEMKSAAIKSQHELHHNDRLRRSFAPGFLKHSEDWDHLVGKFLGLRSHRNELNQWKTYATRYLRERDYSAERIREYLGAVEKHQSFLERTAFLYSSDD